MLGGIGNCGGLRGSRVGIVGGNIGGCAAPSVLGRLRCDVTVFERSSGALRYRGSGRMLVTIGIAPQEAGVATVNDLRLGFVDPSGGEPVLLPSTIYGGSLRPTPEN